jgi:hypothetical protein
MVVNHHPRIHGKTKYGINRTFKVILDLITVKFLGEFSTKPIHIFGGVGLLSLLLSILSTLILIIQKVVSGTDMTGNPLLYLTVLFVLMSVQFLLMGLLAEMLCRTYHESQDKPTYVIRKILSAAFEENRE